MDEKKEQFIHGICWMIGAFTAERLSEKMKECLNNTSRPQYTEEEKQQMIAENEDIAKCMECPYGPTATEPPPPFFGTHPCFECKR